MKREGSTADLMNQCLEKAKKEINIMTIGAVRSFSAHLDDVVMSLFDASVPLQALKGKGLVATIRVRLTDGAPVHSHHVAPPRDAH